MNSGSSTVLIRMSKQHTVSLTFDEWRKVATALEAVENKQRARGLEGEANKYKAIGDKIAEELIE